MTTMATPHTYHLKGHLLGACSCDWGCPCSFEARPTQGWCEGSYVWHVEEGHYHGTTGQEYLRHVYQISWGSA